MPVVEYSPSGKTVNLARLLAAVQVSYPNCTGVGLNSRGKLVFQFATEPAPGFQAAIATVLRDHDGSPTVDPEDALIAAIGAATTLDELKAAVVAWVRAYRRKQ